MNTDTLAARGGTPVRSTPFPVREVIPEACNDAVLDVLRSHNLSSTTGPVTPAFEREFADFYGAAEAVATSSGTSAIHVALAAINARPGSEVITAPITDAGSIVPILYEQLVPVFADVDESYSMRPEAVEALVNDKTAAILVVHLFGNPGHLHDLRAIADRHGIFLIEDAAQAHCTRAGADLIGTVGHIGAFSLQQSKHMTTGDGGVCITDDAHLAREMRLARDKGWDRGPGAGRNYPRLGLNYRITELQSAVGRPQLPLLPALVARRGKLGLYLTERLRDIPGISVPPTNGESSYWAFPFETETSTAGEFAELLTAEGIPVTAGYTGEPIYLCMDALRHHVTFGGSGRPVSGPDQPPVTYDRGLCPQAEDQIARLVIFWLHEDMDFPDLDDVVAAVAKVAGAVGQPIRHDAVSS